MSKKLLKADDVKVLDSAVKDLESDATDINKLRTAMNVKFGKVCEKVLHNSCKGSGSYEDDRKSVAKEVHERYCDRILARGLVRDSSESTFRKWLDSAVQAAVIVNVLCKDKGLEDFEYTVLVALGKYVSRKQGTMKYSARKGYEEAFETVIEELVNNQVAGNGTAVHRRFNELVPQEELTDAEKQVKAEKAAKRGFEKAVKTALDAGLDAGMLLGSEAIAETMAENPEIIAEIFGHLVRADAANALNELVRYSAAAQQQNPELGNLETQEAETAAA